MRDIDLPCIPHVLATRRRDDRSLRIVSPFNSSLDSDDARVSEIMKFRRCRSNARRRSKPIVFPHPHLCQHVFRPFLPHRRPLFSFFPIFPFASFHFPRCKVYTSYTPSNVQRQLNTCRVWCHFLRNFVTRISIELLATTCLQGQ